jgi:Flp pilus assembly protein TadD
VLKRLFQRFGSDGRQALQDAARAAESANDLPAVAALRRKLAKLQPQSADAWIALGAALQKVGEQGEALAAYESALAKGAPAGPLHLTIGALCLSQGRRADAVEHFRQLIASDPGNADAHCMLGATLNDLRRHAEAAGSFERALQLRPDHSEAQFNLGLARFEVGDLDGASACFARCATLRRGEPWAGDLAARLARDPSPAYEPKEMGTNLIKLKHDCEQIEHLLALGKLPPAAHQVLGDYRALYEELRGRVDAFSLVPFDAARHPLVARTYKRPLHISDEPSPAGPLVDPRLDSRAIEDRYLGSKPNLVVCDGLLTPAAIQALRRYCRESTFWNSIKPGYLGSYFFDGFCSRLLLQLAWELRERLPRVLRGLPLQMMWGYKCDNTLPGLAVHADDAAVNVNFWITEDEANLDPEHGGLLVHTQDAPRDWGFAKFNTDPAVIMRYLESVGSVPVRVPYRANRAVIFDSDLFHATDQPRFRDGYTHRRINITFLFGLRSD